MSYLYALIKYFYDELLEVANNNSDLESNFIKNLNNIIQNKSESLYEKIKNGENNYYEVLENVFSCELNDLDLLCDSLSNLSYGKIPMIHFKDGNKEVVNKYQEEKDNDLKKMLYQIVKIDEVIKFFTLLIRQSYLPNFMKDNLDSFKVNEIIESVRYINFYDTYNNKINNYNDVLSSLIDADNLRQDIISNFVDNNETRQLIIEQQLGYIKELDSLLEIIDKVGNITYLNDDLFEVFIKFIFYFKEMAYQKINVLNRVDNKVYKKVLRSS